MKDSTHKLGRAPVSHRPRDKRRRRKTWKFQTVGKSLGAHLRACRRRTGRDGHRHWSLRAVALRAEINHGLLCQIEQGKRRPVAGDLLRLADVLGEDREALLVRAGYLPASALANRGAFNLTAAEREVIECLRARPTLAAPLLSLLKAIDR